MEKQTKLLVIGAPRSGTTMIASMIGSHSKVGMLIEDFHDNMKRIGGKKVAGNKLCIPNQLEFEKKANILSRAVQRIGGLNNYPKADLSIRDYLELENLKIIGIIRNGDKVINSIRKRGEQNIKTALYRWKRALEIINYVHEEVNNESLIISFDKFLEKAENDLKIISDFLNLDYEKEMLEGYFYNHIYPNRKSIDKSKASKEFNKEIEQKFGKDIRYYVNLFNNLYENAI